MARKTGQIIRRGPQLWMTSACAVRSAPLIETLLDTFQMRRSPTSELGSFPPTIDRQAKVIYEVSELGALVQLREYPDNAKVKLNQRSRERMDLVVGFKFMAPKIPADPLLDGWMRPRRGGPIHQLDQE